LLEEIRILSDSDGRRRQLQVVLVGQIELRDKLRLPELRQVDQRVSVRCDLGPLDQAGVAGYVAHRLSVAGGSADRVSFSGDGIAAVYQASGGVPRLINRVCDRALHQGHLRQAAIIDREIVEATLPGMEFASPSRRIPASPATPPASDPIDQWYAAVDRGVTIACESEVIAEQGVAEEAPPPVMASPGRRQRIRTVPLTRIEALTRKWVRRAQVAALVIVVLGGAGLGLMVGWTIVSEAALPVALPAVPQAPRRAAAVKATGVSADPYTSRVVTYSIQLPALDKPDGASDLVIASYPTRAEAESELTRLRELPGYEAAIAVETSDTQHSR
jgi:hypothetical protein